MTRGRTSKILSQADCRRLRQFQREHAQRLGVSIGLPQLRLSMGAPFSWETLQRALAGKPIWESYHEFIVAFLDRHMPSKVSSLFDFKSRASGEREEEETAEPIHRGFAMSRRDHLNKYMQERRARLRREGICVDCQKNEVKPDPEHPEKKHVTCADCRKARRDRLTANARQGALPFFSEATL